MPALIFTQHNHFALADARLASSQIGTFKANFDLQHLPLAYGATETNQLSGSDPEAAAKTGHLAGNERGAPCKTHHLTYD